MSADIRGRWATRTVVPEEPEPALPQPEPSKATAGLRVAACRPVGGLGSGATCQEPPVDTPIFERAGDQFVATTLARGPWDHDACHGGAPAALLAASIDAAPALTAMQGVRLTYDLLRPVPIEIPLSLQVRTVREGKRIQTLEAILTCDDTELVRCRALRIRVDDVPLPEARPGPDAPPRPGPDDLEQFTGRASLGPEGFWHTVDVRFVSGMFGTPGPGVAWFRVAARLTDGLELTPLARVAAAADFGNGIGPPLELGPYRYLNPDLTVDIHRLPVDDWVAVSSRSVAQPNGIGLASSTLADRDGAIGTGLQSLFIDSA